MRIISATSSVTFALVFFCLFAIVQSTCLKGFKCADATCTAETCSQCLIGQYQETNTWAETTCNFCAVATEYVDRNTACTDCDTGKYQNQNDQESISCKFCAAGRFFKTKSTECDVCVAGEYQTENVLASATCKTCQALSETTRDWTFVITTAVTADAGVAVTQGTNIGRLKTSVTSATTIVVTASTSVTFVSTSNVIVGSTTVIAAAFTSATKAYQIKTHLNDDGTDEQYHRLESDCIACQPGNEWRSWTENCHGCQPGQFTVGGDENCKVCGPGTYIPNIEGGSGNCRF